MPLLSIPMGISVNFEILRHAHLNYLVSWSKVIDLGTPCNLTTSRKKRLATWTTSDVFLQATKWAILENLSTITVIESTPCWVLGSPNMKSMDTSSQGCYSIGSGIYKPVFWVCPLDTWHTGHCCTKLPTSFFSCGQKYRSSTKLIVLSLPRCPPNPPPCNSWITCSLKELLGM
jgi:hypothetical protein